jgi:polysaccharide biosynthesis transport protein
MEPLQYFHLVRRWLWLLLLSAFIFGSVSFLTKVTQAPIYRTEVMIAIGNYLESPNPSSQDIWAGMDLAQTYAHLATTYDVLNGVKEALQLQFGVDTLASLVRTEIIEGTSLLQISVSYTDPVLAADITNEIATQLILQSPTNLTETQQDQIELLQGEIDAQRIVLSGLREELDEIDEILESTSTSSEDYDGLQAQRNTLVNQINEASANIAQFTNTIASLQQRTNSVEIVESARIPSSPVGSGALLTTALGAFAGAALAFGAAMAFEYFNDSFRTTEELSQSLKLPVLGVISRFGKKSDAYGDRLISSLPNFSQTTEEYRILRTNLLYSIEKESRIFIVSSASPQEGKSVTAANLATSMALAGLRVLLLDADLRRPKAHEIFALQNNLGLANLLTRQNQAGKEAESSEMTWQAVIQKTAIPNLYVVTSGFTPSNPSELLGSLLLKRLVDGLRNTPQLDVIIFDTPPVLAVSDSAVLAASIEAKVLLIVNAGRTRRNHALKAKERFQHINVDIAGLVLNGADLRDDDFYGYSYGYYYSNDKTSTGSSKPIITEQANVLTS